MAGPPPGLTGGRAAVRGLAGPGGTGEGLWWCEGKLIGDRRFYAV